MAPPKYKMALQQGEITVLCSLLNYKEYSTDGWLMHKQAQPPETSKKKLYSLDPMIRKRPKWIKELVRTNYPKYARELEAKGIIEIKEISHITTKGKEGTPKNVYRIKKNLLALKQIFSHFAFTEMVELITRIKENRRKGSDDPSYLLYFYKSDYFKDIKPNIRKQFDKYRTEFLKESENVVLPASFNIPIKDLMNIKNREVKG